MFNLAGVFVVDPSMSGAWHLNPPQCAVRSLLLLQLATTRSNPFYVVRALPPEQPKKGGGDAPQHVRSHAAAPRHPGRHEHLPAAAVAGVRSLRQLHQGSRGGGLGEGRGAGEIWWAAAG